MDQARARGVDGKKEEEAGPKETIRGNMERKCILRPSKQRTNSRHEKHSRAQRNNLRPSLSCPIKMGLDEPPIDLARLDMGLQTSGLARHEDPHFTVDMPLLWS